MILKATLEHSGIPLDVLARDADFVNAHALKTGVGRNRVRSFADSIQGTSGNIYFNYQQGEPTAQIFVFDPSHDPTQAAFYEVDAHNLQKALNGESVIDLTRQTPVFKGYEAVETLMNRASRLIRHRIRSGDLDEF